MADQSIKLNVTNITEERRKPLITWFLVAKTLKLLPKLARMIAAYLPTPEKWPFISIGVNSPSIKNSSGLFLTVPHTDYITIKVSPDICNNCQYHEDSIDEEWGFDDIGEECSYDTDTYESTLCKNCTKKALLGNNVVVMYNDERRTKLCGCHYFYFDETICELHKYNKIRHIEKVMVLFTPGNPKPVEN